MKIGKWDYTGKEMFSEIDYENGIKNVRQVGPRAFQFVEIIDMHEASGEKEGDRYASDVSYVDLDKLPSAEIGNAVESCGGWLKGEEEPNDRMLAEACDSYGLHAPLWSGSGNVRRELLRDAYRHANEYARHPDALADALGRTVNAIGSTAAEFMTGDLDAAVSRGLKAGNPEAQIFAKMQDKSTIECPACHGKGKATDPRTKVYLDGACGLCDGAGKVVQTLGGLRPARKE